MNTFRITIASPPDREKLVAMIDVGDEQWAEVSQETAELQIEFYARRDGKPWALSLSEAQAAIDAAKARLTGS